VTVAGSCRKSCKPCTVAEIPDDVVNFFNSSLSSAVRRVSSDDDDVGLLQLDSDTTNDGLPTSDGHVDTGNLFCATLCVCYHQCVNCSGACHLRCHQTTATRFTTLYPEHSQYTKNQLRLERHHRHHSWSLELIFIGSLAMGGSVAEWLACCTQAQKGLGSNRSRDIVG